MSWRYINQKKTSTSRCLEIIRQPVVTEKATLGSEHNQVTLCVSMDASKPEIRRAVETLFNVKVHSVNTLISKGKRVRFRGVRGTRPDWKKAIIRLEEGQSIDLTATL